ncbi:hypothetical protein AOQ84DRAFT_7708 [Glonium stellatum]|uniref:Transmembrane protein n=1 Tax=Glonium stellatum TaxID=574774 RepID=A0A8E2JUE3_9PEZI|nr:hypothetical protein AOQ84DRAFT_7708 [Glonium stellatum]
MRGQRGKWNRGAFGDIKEGELRTESWLRSRRTVFFFFVTVSLFCGLASCTLLWPRDTVTSGFKLLDSGPTATFPLHKYFCVLQAGFVALPRFGEEETRRIVMLVRPHRDVSFDLFRHPLSPKNAQQFGSREE